MCSVKQVASTEIIIWKRKRKFSLIKRVKNINTIYFGATVEILLSFVIGQILWGKKPVSPDPLVTLFECNTWKEKALVRTVLWPVS